MIISGSRAQRSCWAHGILGQTPGYRGHLVRSVKYYRAPLSNHWETSRPAAFPVTFWAIKKITEMSGENERVDVIRISSV